MAIVLNEVKKMCSIRTNGPIQELGFINGPIRKAYVSITTIGNMVRNGKVVYELNPNDETKEIKMTLANYQDTHFGKDVTPVASTALEVKEEKKEVPVEPVIVDPVVTPESDIPTVDEVPTTPEEPKQPVQNTQNPNTNGKNSNRNNDFSRK